MGDADMYAITRRLRVDAGTIFASILGTISLIATGWMALLRDRDKRQFKNVAELKAYYEQRADVQSNTIVELGRRVAILQEEIHGVVEAHKHCEEDHKAKDETIKRLEKELRENRKIQDEQVSRMERELRKLEGENRDQQNQINDLRARKQEKPR